jgi:hypothetical protein
MKQKGARSSKRGELAISRWVFGDDLGTAGWDRTLIGQWALVQQSADGKVGHQKAVELLSNQIGP